MRAPRGWSARPPSGSIANKRNGPSKRVLRTGTIRLTCVGSSGPDDVLRLYDSSTRQQEVNRALPAQPRVQPADAPLLFKPRADGRGCAAGTFGILGDFGVDVLVRHRHLFPPRHLVEHERAAHRFGRGLLLPLAEFFPVDVRL